MTTQEQREREELAERTAWARRNAGLDKPRAHADIHGLFAKYLRSEVAAEPAGPETTPCSQCGAELAVRYRTREGLELQSRPGPGVWAYTLVDRCPQCHPSLADGHPLAATIVPSSANRNAAARRAAELLAMLDEPPRRSPGRMQATAVLREWVAGRARCAVLWGTSRAGKTHLAMHAFAAVARATDGTCNVVEETAVVHAFQRQWDRDDESERAWAAKVRALWRTADVLLLDDLCLVQQSTAGVMEAVQEVVESRRYHKGRLLVTSNLDPKDWAQARGERVAQWLRDLAGEHIAQVRRVGEPEGGR